MAADQEAARAPGPIAGRLGHLRTTLAVTGMVLALTVVAGAAMAGSAGALGAAAGVLVVVSSYLLSDLAVAWADSVSPKLVFSVGLGTYLFKFSLFGMALLAAPGDGWAGQRPLAVAMVAAVVCWVGAQVWWTARHGTPTSDATRSDPDRI
ncbi:hypothetical protein [Paractinoplanes hotanensis]|uniref:ATP synthase protein I n=1 Tax=Paractinoplanes hotanensis TaxID=2906497 RepID=A0ABT0XSS0_9ACTN|nr:hypothetical protein [Actinoplanes hotanensis]MCM4076826.1 hypothetical protein [Actinoplanes hotanensis]